jgi:hypothetical protein
MCKACVQAGQMTQAELDQAVAVGDSSRMDLATLLKAGRYAEARDLVTLVETLGYVSEARAEAAREAIRTMIAQAN